MVYLYAGLGIAMLSGIMAIFEMGLAVTGQSLLRPPEDVYSSDIVAKNFDKSFIQNLYDGEWEKDFKNAIPPIAITCNNLIEAEGYSWKSLEAGFFKGSCAANNLNHRILVEFNSGNSSYRVYTCFVESDNGKCSFEQED